MRRIPSGALWAVLIPVLVPAASVAQLAPDTPRLVSPTGPGGLAVYWSRPDAVPGDDAAVLATWVLPGLPSVRLRGGLGIGANDDEAVLGGIDVQAPMTRRREGLPFDLDWQGGIGISVGEHTLVTLPVGVAAGTSWSSGTVWLAPYASAGLAADLWIGDDYDGDEFEVDPALDVGLDLSLDSDRDVVLRAAVSLGDRQALAIGLAIGGGGRTR